MKVIAINRRAAFTVALLGALVAFNPDANGVVCATVDDEDMLELFSKVKSDYRLVDDTKEKVEAAAKAEAVKAEADKAAQAKAATEAAAKAEAVKAKAKGA